MHHLTWQIASSYRVYKTSIPRWATLFLVAFP